MSVQRTVTSQSELDAAIAAAVPLIIIDSPSTVWLTIRDLGSSRAVLWGSSSAELRGSSSAELWESSRAELATGTSSVHMHGSAALAKAGPRTAVFRHSHEASIAEGGVLIDCTEPNTELLQTTLGQIEAHPEQWNQSQGVSTTDCGTAYCFAGWAAQLSGAVDVVTNDNARGIAASELNLADSDAERLFAAGNTLDDLRREVARLINPVAVSS